MNSSTSVAKSGSSVAVECSGREAAISDNLRRLGSAARSTATGFALRSITISAPDCTRSSNKEISRASSVSVMCKTAIPSIIRLPAHLRFPERGQLALYVALFGLKPLVKRQGKQFANQFFTYFIASPGRPRVKRVLGLQIQRH